MVIIKNKNYNKSYRKKILDKHKEKEKIRIASIENIIISSLNLQDLMNSPYKKVYHIEQKKGNLKEYYTARINDKIRLVMKPLGDFPYNMLEIVELEFIDIDEHHYGEG